MVRIKRLTQQLANQVAAGEVIERPASVVKELLENSLDAGAKNICIEVSDGGKTLIRVSDDGHGICPDDLSLALASHATSKIACIEDLFAISSLGFRGEALASISAVSRFSLKSKTIAEQHAYQIEAQGQDIKSEISAAAYPQGTEITVRDLFFNTPVRRKFLRMDKTEFGHIEILVKRLALSHFAVAFKLIHNQQIISFLPAATNQLAQQARITKIFGSGFIENAKYLSVEQDGLTVWGWLGTPEFARSNNDLQYTYLNQRLVRDKLINHALRQGYGETLYPGKHAVFALYLSVDPKQVDVNVHPTKHEVRFCQARQVHDLLVSQVRHCVGNDENVVPSVAANYAIARTNGGGEKSLAVEHISLAVAGDDLQVLAWLPDNLWLVSYPPAHLLCNYQQLYVQLTYQRLLAAWRDDTVAARPLLIPVKLSLDNLVQVVGYFAVLKKLGLDLAQIDDNVIVIRELPILTAHLDFTLFLDSLIKAHELGECDEEKIIYLLAAANVAGPYLESTELGQVTNLLKDNLAQGSDDYYKILTATDWAQLLNV